MRISTIKNDRRKAQRLNIPLKIEQRLFRSKALLKTVCKDISGGGLRLHLPNRLKVGERLKTVIYFPVDPHPVTAFSEVIWCRKRSNGGKNVFDTGIKYIKVLPKDRNRFVFLFCETMINYFMQRPFK